METLIGHVFEVKIRYKQFVQGKSVDVASGGLCFRDIFGNGA